MKEPPRQLRQAIIDHNRAAWDLQVARRDRWTVPVGPEDIARARRGEWELVLTPRRAVPREWFGQLSGARVLGLASGGGQQCPILAATGAAVTSLDLSPAQLAQDRAVAEREGLDLTCVQGDMADLSQFSAERFDLVFHPCSNCFVPDVLPVWREVYRVLKPGGVLLAGFINPLLCLFDGDAMAQGQLTVRHSLPYSDLSSLPDAEREAKRAEREPWLFGHTLTDQLAGQARAGLAIVDLYEDDWGSDALPLDKYSKSFLATRSVKWCDPGRPTVGSPIAAP